MNRFFRHVLYLALLISELEENYNALSKSGYFMYEIPIDAANCRIGGNNYEL
jgi:hypothetical protein